MGLFSLFTETDINKGIEEWQGTENAVLLDVRSASRIPTGSHPWQRKHPPRQHRTCNEEVPEERYSALRSLLKRRPKRQGGELPKARGIYQREKHRRHQRLYGKGGAIAMKVVIVGGVAGGATAAARLRRLDEQAEIIIFERTGIRFIRKLRPSLLHWRRDRREKQH